jgi:ketosteroid isomerase-like protein
MTESQENVEKLREGYRLWHETRGGSVQAWLDLLADDVVMRSLADGAPGMELSRGRRGKTEAQQYFAELGAAWEMIHFTADTFIAEGDRVVMVGRCAFKHRQTGKAVESPKVDVFRFEKGKIVECMELYDTAGALAAARPD